LKDTGERDEHGMQPLDAIFSSPGDAEANRDESGSEDMEISSSELNLFAMRIRWALGAIAARRRKTWLTRICCEI
jgi:hypothetical protein